MAKPELMIDNDRTRFIRWKFRLGEGTRQHTHKCDNVSVPLEDVELKLIDGFGSVTISNVFRGISYPKNMGVTHNFINNYDFHLA